MAQGRGDLGGSSAGWDDSRHGCAHLCDNSLLPDRVLLGAPILRPEYFYCLCL